MTHNFRNENGPAKRANACQAGSINPGKDIDVNSTDTITGAGETPDLNTVQSDVWHLYHLLDATMDLLMEMPYEREGKRDVDLDRIAALAWIARDRAQHIALDIDNNFHSIERGPQ
ncbi:hypothetical protein [Rhizobium sp. Leaf386]|uniref:hypothetical protein n=1 Tax=Rhizobium sp. Leaf386 TaxID=1736359 RepID=UPI000712DCDA|nr:hypothetical protein [Rhizobium sp. Leaf386]KQT04134.1 hypothetical protein ASG50_18215 [Rhizobium sp. Leaf386]